MSSVEEGIDIHLNLDCGDNFVTSQTPHIPPENADTMQLTEYVTSDSLNLSRRKLKDIVDCILKNHMLKNLYLEGNQISSVPDSLFTSLSNLEWLDLRNNQIKSLPAEIGLHRCLKTLLLEGNPITELPLELGNVITLRALSLRHCPVTFPPPEIVQQGVQSILRYLRAAMAERPVSMRNLLPDVLTVEKLQLAELVTSSLDVCEEAADADELRTFKELKQKMIQMDRAEFGDGTAALPLARPPGTAGSDRVQKTYFLPIVKRKKEISKGNIFPELPPFDMQYWKRRSEERRLAAMKELKEKQDILEQRRKDQDLLREWRTHAKIMHERKIFEHKQERRERHEREETLRKAALDVQPRLSCSEAAAGLASDAALCLPCTESAILQQSEAPSQLKAPYATDSLCSVPEVPAHRSPRRQRSVLSQREHEEARAARDGELQQRIRSHVQAMQERRRKPRGTAQEETAAARHDMEEAKRLQAELAARKEEKDLEYRFTAFTGDIK